VNTARRPAVLIVDDERLLAAELRRAVAATWPEAEVVAEAYDGNDALARVRALAPDVTFLDIRMPGLSGLEVAQQIGASTHVVFVTAYDEYAVQAFEAGAVDYLLKPVEPERLAVTVERLRARLDETPRDLGSVLQQLLRQGAVPAAQRLQWLQVGEGSDIRILPVAEVCLFQAADKYTLVRTMEREWVIRTPLKELEDELDPELFWRVHRNTIVRVAAIELAHRDVMGRVSLRVRGLRDAVAVSRAHAHLFRQR
jgi:DNA-binding LytR/AlgR family response regulator